MRRLLLCCHAKKAEQLVLSDTECTYIPYALGTSQQTTFRKLAVSENAPAPRHPPLALLVFRGQLALDDLTIHVCACACVFDRLCVQ